MRIRPLLLALPFLVGGFALTSLNASEPAEPAPAPREPGKPDATAAAVELDKKIMEAVKEKPQLMPNLQHLSDVIGPRLTGSKNLDNASKWTADKMKEYGLENVRLEPWEIPTAWERGTATMKLLEPNNGRTISVASSAWAPSTKGKVVGPVVVLNIRAKEDIEKYRGKLKNAVILRSPPFTVAPITDMSYIGLAPGATLDKGPGQGRNTPKKETPKKDEAKAGSDAEAKKVEAKKEEQPPAKKDTQPPAQPQPVRPGFGGFGAFATEVNELLAKEGIAANLNQSNKPHGLLTTGGRWRGKDRGEGQEGPASLTVSIEHYAMLWRLASDPNRKVEVELEVTNKFIPGPIAVYNTVGEIRGSEKPDEFVTIGAHLDSWDLGQGTTDNGTGSCVILECARVLGALAKQGIRPKRTIRFVLYTGEEQGLVGSAEYVRKHADEMPKTSVSLVHDTGTGKVKGFALMGREPVRKVLEPELTTLAEVGFEGVSLRFSGGSDHASFDSRGVPGFAAIQDTDEYRLTHHTQTDTFDKAKEPNLIQGAQVMAVTAMRIANLPDLLPREGGRGGAGGFPRKGDEPKKDEKKEVKKDKQ